VLYDTAQLIQKLHAASLVLSAEIKLDEHAIAGGNLLRDTSRIIKRLREAATSGVATAWITLHIEQDEQTVMAANCSRCFSMLEAARPY
jgi:hypothetical protein